MRIFAFHIIKLTKSNQHILIGIVSVCVCMSEISAGSVVFVHRQSGILLIIIFRECIVIQFKRYRIMNVRICVFCTFDVAVVAAAAYPSMLINNSF